jgi:hypothetical protein
MIMTGEKTANNLDKLMLSSNITRTSAHEFYQKLGFEQHGWSFKCVVQKPQKESVIE